ncbi:MAG TPA: Crp/Fnr family transcriptional regulator [Spirochaetota bacterium]|nr:Crp/Fnr family transcriptional regulator [Spirochaetota bacterium]
MDKNLEAKFGITKKAGEIIFCEYEPGSTIYFIQEGNVRLTKIVSNKEKTLAIIGAGDIFGEMAILEKQPRSATAIAEDDIKMLEFDKESFAQLVQMQPGLAMKLLKIFASRITDQRRKLKIMTLTTNDAKILDVLIMLAEKLNYDPQKTKELELDTDIAQIANWAGISHKVCEQDLYNLERAGKIQVRDKTIFVYNLYAAQRYVQSKRNAAEREI